jgi:hypothetical protein
VLSDNLKQEINFKYATPLIGIKKGTLYCCSRQVDDEAGVEWWSCWGSFIDRVVGNRSEICARGGERLGIVN